MRLKDRTLNEARNPKMAVPVLNGTCRRKCPMPMGDESSENEEENSADVIERSDDDEDQSDSQYMDVS